MKIGFPVLKKALTDALEFNDSLHGSKLFGVFDTNDNTVKILKTSSDDETMGMDLIHFLKGEKVSCIISSACHPMAARFFINNDIGLFKALGSNILSNIDLLMDNKLKPFTDESTVSVASCSLSCSSCSSSCNEDSEDIAQI